MAAPKDQTAPAAAAEAPAKPAKQSIFARSPKRKAAKKGKEVVSPAVDSTTGPGKPQQNGEGSAPHEPAQPQSVIPTPIPSTTIVTPTTPTHDGSDGVEKPIVPPSNSDPSSEPGQAPVPASQAPSTPPPAEPASAEGPEPAPATEPSTPIPAPSEQADDTDRDREKDKGSLSTTLTGTQHTRLTSKGAQTASDGAHSTTATEPASIPRSTGKQKAIASSSSRPRVSFISRLVHVLVPCVGSSQLPLDPDGDVALGETNTSATVLREKQVAERNAPQQQGQATTDTKVPKTDAQTTPEVASSTSTPAVAQPNNTSSLQPLVVAPSTPPQPASPDEDLDIVVPPTPSKLISPDETGGVTSSAVVPPGATAEEVTQLRPKQHPESEDESDGTSFTEDDDAEEGGGVDEAEDDEDRLILNGGAGIPTGPDGTPRPLLPPISPQHAGRKCLVLDLDETLVHSSFKSIQQADYVVPVEIEYHWHNVYVIKRPGVDSFLKKMGEMYEVVVFTASLSKYADPVLDKLDINHVVAHRLFRESCYNHKGNYVKDLSQLGRPIADTIILDNSPASYIFHPNNAVPVSSWFNDPHDTELTDLCPFLGDLGTVDDVRGVLDGGL